MEEKVINALNLEPITQKNFIKFYQTLGEKPPTTIRFFDRSDFYSIHGEDTEFISKLIYKSTAHVKLMSPGEVQGLPYVTLSKSNFETAIRELLLVKNYRVEVFTRKGDRSNDWQVEFKGSPGNLIAFEDILFNENEVILGNAVIAIHIKIEGNHKLIGLGCVDTNDCLISVTEFIDNDFFTELEATAVILSPKECLLPSLDGDFDRIKTIMERNGVLVTVRKKTNFNRSQSDLVQDLNKLINFRKGQQEDANTLPEISKTTAMFALGAIINYLDLTKDLANLGHFDLKELNLDRFVHLDAAAVSALNVFPKPGTSLNSPAYRWESIIGVLDRCRTPQGHRLITQWVKQPLRNEAQLKDRHDIVQCLIDSPSALNYIYDDFLKRTPDILLLTKKLLRKKASLLDMFRIYQVILRIPKLLNTLLDLESSTVKSVICDPLKEVLRDLKMFKQMVEQVIDLEGIEKGEYFVKASFDDELQEMKTRMDELLEKINAELRKCTSDLDHDSLKLDYVSHLGYHFRVALKDDSLIRKNSNYRVLDAVKGGVRFTTRKLTSYNEEFSEIKEKYEEQQKAIVNEVIKVAVGYFSPLLSLNGEIAQLDCLVSFAVAAKSAPIPYVRPKIFPEGTGILHLEKVRHPCLELQDGVTFIANDINLVKDDTLMYIITGPNMGGKSTYIRSVGTAVLMAHVGSFVPCEKAEITMVDSILGRIGASDNIIKGLSTFLVEMIETSGIIRTATDKSLVIIDELGRGTSTYDGCGLAWSISEHLAKETRCFALFATHFHEITELAEYVTTVKNYHMATIADDERFALLYQIRPGITDKSFGIHIARLASFPENVVKIAEEKYAEFEDENKNLKTENDEKVINEVISKLEEISENKNISDDELRQVIENLQEKITNSKSEYFKAVAS